MFNNKNFYPTPDHLIKKMWNKVQDKIKVKNVLEPSAGKGNILDFLNKGTEFYDYRERFLGETSCIENDPNLQAILKSKKYKVIDTDFLEYSGYDKFDLIIMNPPFDNGSKHLLTAIDIMYSGQIVCLLNAETLKNPYSINRKELVKILNKLNADIEYIKDGFVDAERKTNVEVALIYIDMRRNEKSTLFNNCTDKSNINYKVDEETGITSSDRISSKVERYNNIIKSGIEFIIKYNSYKEIQNYIHLSIDENEYKSINEQINKFVSKVRKKYWLELLELNEVKERLTEKKRGEFIDQIQKQSYMEFTESNIRQFMVNLVSSYEYILADAVVNLFDRFTRYNTKEYSGNIHYFNGWKTNEAYFVNKKVILPTYASFTSNCFIGWSGWEVTYQAKNYMRDIDIVMRYFSDLKSDEIIDTIDAIEQAFKMGKTRNIESTFFIMSIYKKGTIHLTFKDDELRRRFNLVACKGKMWLPEDYGKEAYSNLSKEYKDIVDTFEGEKSYNKNRFEIGFSKNNQLKLDI